MSEQSVETTEHGEEILAEHTEVAFDSEFGIIHDPDGEHGNEYPVVESVTLRDVELFACRRCFGFPGTAADLDELLSGDSDSNRPDGQESLTRWSA